MGLRRFQAAFEVFKYSEINQEIPSLISV
jgi:hypothetical protein